MIALFLLAVLTGTQSPPTSPAPTTLALVTTFADGITHFELISERSAWYWGTKFPVIDGATNIPSALKLTRHLVAGVAKVGVSLMYFGPNHREVEVATVVVPRDGSVVVDEPLRRYGVQPIRLSLAVVTPPTPFPPSVFSDIPELEISGVEILTAPYPGYRVTVRNLSNRAASSFGVQTYRDETKALSGLESGKGGRPVLRPMDSYTFDFNLTGGGGTNGPALLDTIEITSVMWADGSSAGGPMTAAAHGVPADAGARVVLEQANAVLRAAVATPDVSFDAVLRQLNAIPGQDDTLLPAAQRSRSQARQMVIDDVRRIQKIHSAATDREALQTLIRRYENIISRLSPL